MSHIELLLEAARFIDQREAELCDHQYSASASAPAYQRHRTVSRKPKQRTTSSSSQNSGGRSLHNELEKNRRANLRNCLERLRDIIPSSHGPSAKNTTLQLLKRAKLHIVNLEEEHRAYEETKTWLINQRTQLNEHLRRHERSSSSSSCDDSQTSSPSSTVTTAARTSTFHATFQFLQDSDASSPSASISDNDDVDIMGSASESDDYGR